MRKVYHERILENGLRIIQETAPTGNVYCGIIVEAGTCHEDKADVGLAHFCEHTTFKGTERRKAYHIRCLLERVGGELNAYTNKEETCYYATVPRGEFGKAADLLADIVFHSTFPQKELEKEKQVIADEIDSYRDSPAELIYDEFERIIFKNHPLGRDILGTVERLKEYGTEDALRFTRKYYKPSNCTFFILGNVSFEKAVEKIEKATVGLSGEKVEKIRHTLEPLVGRTVRRKHDTHQAHVLVGNRSYGRGHENRAALLILNNILGGPGMNSLLGVSLREKSGLVYVVDSSIYAYEEAGIWAVYFGCDEGNVERCCELVGKELRRLCAEPIGEAQLRAAKKQICGQIALSNDHLGSYALAMGKYYAYTGKHRDVDEFTREIKTVTADDMLRAAEDVFAPDNLTTLIYI